MYFLSLILYFYLSASIIASPFPEQSDFIDNSEGNPDLIASSDIDSNDLVATTQNRQDSNYVNPGDFPSSGTPITNYQSQLNTILVAERKKGRKGRWVIPNPRTAKTPSASTNASPPPDATPPVFSIPQLRGMLGKMGNWIDQQLDELGQNDDGSPRQFTSLQDIDMNKLFAATMGFAAVLGVPLTGAELNAAVTAAFPYLLEGLVVILF